MVNPNGFLISSIYSVLELLKIIDSNLIEEALGKKTQDSKKSRYDSYRLNVEVASVKQDRK